MIEKYKKYLSKAYREQCEELGKINSDNPISKIHLSVAISKIEDITKRITLIENENKRLCIEGTYALFNEFKKRLGMQFQMLADKIDLIFDKLQEKHSPENPFSFPGVSVYYCAFGTKENQTICVYGENNDYDYVIEKENFDIKIYTNYKRHDRPDDRSIAEILRWLYEDEPNTLHGMIECSLYSNIIDHFELCRYLSTYSMIYGLWEHFNK